MERENLDAPWTFVPQWKKAGNLAGRWKKVAGEDQWAGLLDPLDTDLKSELLRSGEFLAAASRAFDGEAHSRYRGSSLWHPTKLLGKEVAPATGYTVTKFLWSLARINVLKSFPTGSTPSISGLWSGHDDNSNWAGFVAVATDPAEIARLGRRDFLVVFRGTKTTLEWVHDLEDIQLSIPGGGKVQQGFWDLYTHKDPAGPPTSVTSAQEQVNAEIRRLMGKYQGEQLSITVAGHSLGAALANLCAFDLASSGANQLNLGGPVQVLDAKLPQEVDDSVVETVVKEVTSLIVGPLSESTVTTVTGVESGNTAPKLPNGFVAGTVPITVHSLAGPRVGNHVFRDTLHNLGVKMLRVVNSWDIIPRLPGVVTNELLSNALDTTHLAGLVVDSLPWTYTHAGLELAVSNFDSTFLKTGVDIAAWHDLEIYLHLLAGYESSKKPFDSKLAEESDPARVNSATDYLKEEYLVPGSWRVTPNKGLVRHPATGRWVQRPREEEDLPSNCLGIYD